MCIHFIARGQTNYGRQMIRKILCTVDCGPWTPHPIKSPQAQLATLRIFIFFFNIEIYNAALSLLNSFAILFSFFLDSS